MLRAICVPATSSDVVLSASLAKSIIAPKLHLTTCCLRSFLLLLEAGTETFKVHDDY